VVRVTALGSSLDVADVLDSAADLLPKHQLHLAQARRAVTSECAVVFLALMNFDHREPVTEVSIEVSIDSGTKAPILPATRSVEVQHNQTVARGGHVSRHA